MSLLFARSTAASKWSSSLTKDSFLEFGPVKEALSQPKVLGSMVSHWKDKDGSVLC